MGQKQLYFVKKVIVFILFIHRLYQCNSEEEVGCQ